MSLTTRSIGSVLAFLFVAFSAQASFFDDLIDGDLGAITGKVKIRSWNQDNKGKFSIVDTRLGCGGYEHGSDYVNRSRRSDCTMSGLLVNNTNEYIKAVVVNIRFYNNQAQSLVVEQQQVIWAAAVPTVSADFNAYFDSDELRLAYTQLGENYSWNFEIIGAVPKKMNPEWLLDED